MNKKIGILGWKTGPNSFGITLPYYHFLSQYGEVVIIEPNNEINKGLDLLVLPGGPDLDTSQYDIDKFDMTIGKPCPIRTFFMQKRLQGYIDSGIPLFGICLGHQMLAAYTGNTLIPDMFHETNKEDRSELVHSILLDKDFVNRKYITDEKGNKANVIKVNSIHHQAVCAKNIINASPIAIHKPTTKTTLGREVEALKYANFKGYSVQWHPEEIYDQVSHAMILELLELEGH